MTTAVGELHGVPSVGHRWLHLRWLLVAGLVLAVAAAFMWWRARPAPVQYTTAPVTRGPIVRAVIATGAVNPVITVQVGAFVSGTIQALD